MRGEQQKIEFAEKLGITDLQRRILCRAYMWLEDRQADRVCSAIYRASGGLRQEFTDREINNAVDNLIVRVARLLDRCSGLDEWLWWQHRIRTTDADPLLRKTRMAWVYWMIENW
ncbi:hypothetical protein BcepSauron_390 [Burkholderia phage BcepSauron]|uniref:Uncharacterized protein n=2 Tax=Sarumanvirus TaxID=2843450 RepID=A0A482MNR9_9CAUD|nr:hypothetical protein H1O16_gp388 [Burkholderia phage BcepSaruman]YP_009904768.1 hypothetical protein H1O17_gp390 [Burkholderia phage BcepSauron]QBQ74770.1 hypothetical protein BcepSauron_390 [Burkholderia phage BcepSauron]QBX06801.1 hypothetical protein BcepSaruman_388 [Burkholderia phage BcepSaruman]